MKSYIKIFVSILCCIFLIISFSLVCVNNYIIPKISRSSIFIDNSIQKTYISPNGQYYLKFEGEYIYCYRVKYNSDDPYIRLSEGYYSNLDEELTVMWDEDSCLLHFHVFRGNGFDDKGDDIVYYTIQIPYSDFSV